MRLLWLKAEYFKGFRENEFKFKDLQIVRGENGSGKTTLFDAWLWLITDKQADLRSNPEVHPDFALESEPTVTAGIDFDGRVVTLCKTQKDMRTKKQKEEGAPVRISNKYEINGVPKTQKDFAKALEEYGVNVENFITLTHTNVFVGMKDAEQRKILFSMVPDITDLDVAMMIPECTDAVEQLKEYTWDEVVATHRKMLKRANDQSEALPQQIIGMEKSKVKVNPKLQDEKKGFEDQIHALSEQLVEIQKISDTTLIEAKITQLENLKIESYNKANEDRLTNLRKAQDEYSKASTKCMDLDRKISRYKADGNNLNSEFRTLQAERIRLVTALQGLKDEAFHVDTICPTCGQNIPKKQLEQAKANWDADIRSKADDINRRIAETEKRLDEIRAKAKALSAEVKKCEGELATAEVDKKRIQDSMSDLCKVITPDTKAIDAEIVELKGEIVDIGVKVKEAENIRANTISVREKLDEVNKKIAQELNNEFIDQNIDHLKDEIRRYAQMKADAEKILYQMQLISGKKNELLTDTVNSHFKYVRFKLFDVQKNGETKDACIPMVQCSDGEYRDLRYAANTAAIERTKIDICSGLQKYFGQNLPIFVDGAECFDTENLKKIECDSQLILLCVSDDKELRFD